MSKKIRGHENVSVDSLQDKSKEAGWLTKLGGRGLKSNWKRRWFVLTDEYLFYFKSQNENQPRGVVKLSQYSVVKETDEKKKHNCFKIMNPANQSLRIFYIHSDSKEDMQKWIRAMSEQFAKQEAKMREKATTYSGVRSDCSLIVRVAEARNLKGMNLDGSSDPYCLIQISGQQIRTQTVWKNLSPFWGEEYVLHVSDPSTDSLIITIFDEDKALKDEPMGKVVFPIKSLGQEVHEQWYSLVPENYRHFVSGDIHLKIRHIPAGLLGVNSEGALLIEVIEARNLAAKDANGFSDPYVKLTFGKASKKTEIMKKTLNPVYNKEFEFKIQENEYQEILVTVWDWDRVGSNEFMGMIRIPLDSLPPDTTVDKWYMLNPDSTNAADEQDEKSEKEGSSLGDIRLKMKYTEMKILPMNEYNELIDLLEYQNLSIVSALGEVTSEREAVARALTRLFQSRNKAPLLINTLTTREVANTAQAETIFRGNSLATKSLDLYMKLVGLPYLHRTLGSLVKEIYESKDSFEIDPTKLPANTPSDVIERNAKLLRDSAKKFILSILKSVDDSPTELRNIFHNLQKACVDKWGADHITRYTAISGFIFLRFFGPAILGPRLFELTNEHPDQRAARNLTLIAKIVQNLGNLVQFGAKEEYMKDFNTLIQEHLTDVQLFIDTISTLPNSPNDLPPINIDTGKEIASVYNHLLKEKDKVLNSDTIIKDTAIEKLDDVIERLRTNSKKYEN